MESVDKALVYAYRDRRAKKRDFRSLWIVRIGAAARAHEMSYSTFMAGLSKANVDLNRKQLAELAIHDDAAWIGPAFVYGDAVTAPREQDREQTTRESGADDVDARCGWPAHVLSQSP